MIALLMAAGRGERLGDRTVDSPKSMLRLPSGRTLLDYNIDLLTEIGIDDIRIVTGYESRKIEEHVSNRLGVSCVYNPFWAHCNVLGSLYIGLQCMDQPFLFLHADTLASPPIWRKLLDIDGHMVLPYQTKRCGSEEMKVQINDQGELTAISKETDPIAAQGEFLGIGKFSKNANRYFRVVGEELFKSSGLQLYMEAVIEQAIRDKESVLPFDIGNEPFVEVDYEEDYLRACELFE